MSAPEQSRFQHSPYAYHAVPEAYRTAPTIDDPLHLRLDGDSAGAPGLRTDSIQFSHFAPMTTQALGEGTAAGMYYKRRGRLTQDSIATLPDYQSSLTTISNQVATIGGNPATGNQLSIQTGGNVSTRGFHYIPNQYVSVPQLSSAPTLPSYSETTKVQRADDCSHPASPVSTPRRPPPRNASTFDRDTKAHRLDSNCTYLEFPAEELATPAHWPEHCTIDAYYPTSRAFVGQVRFETTAEQVAWVIEQTAHVTPAFVAYHRHGCFVVHFSSQEDCDRAVAFNKCILFDVNGVWVSTDENGQNAIAKALRLKHVLHKYLLPRGAMVIEHFTDNRGPNVRR